MKMNTKSRMAIAAIMDVAVNGTAKPVPLSSVSERQAISLSYLEQLFRKLRERGFVTSTRGPGGGYRMNQRLADITVADIVTAVDGDSTDSCGCTAGDNQNCKFHGLWCVMTQHLNSYLSSVTLDSILPVAANDPIPGPMASVPPMLSAAKLAQVGADRQRPALM